MCSYIHRKIFHKSFIAENTKLILLKRKKEVRTLKRRILSLILCFIICLSFFAVVESAYASPAESQIWSKLLHDGQEYSVHVASEPAISNPLGRPLSFNDDAPAITRIYAIDGEGVEVEDVLLRRLLVIGSQNVERFINGIDSFDVAGAISINDIHKETRTDNLGNEYFIVPPLATTEWWRTAFLYSNLIVWGTDGYDHRVNIWEQVILDAVLQPDLYEALSADPQLMKELSRFLHGSKLTLTVSNMILKGKLLFKLNPDNIQTTLLNWGKVTLRKNMLTHLTKLSAAIGAITVAVDVYADVVRMFFLGSLANAFAEERLEALEQYIQENTADLDPALVDAIDEARQKLDEIATEYYDTIHNFFQASWDHAVDIAAAITFLASAFKLLPAAVAKIALPYYLSYQLYMHLLDQSYKVQRLSLAAALQRTFAGETSADGILTLQDELETSEFRDHEKLNIALNLFTVNHYLGFYFYKNYYEALNVPIFKQLGNWWTGGVLDQALHYYNSRATTQLQMVMWIRPTSFFTEWHYRGWDDWTWLLEKAMATSQFHITVESLKQWYKIGETTITEVTILNGRDETTYYWIGVSFKDPDREVTKYDPQITVTPQYATLDPGETITHIVQWTIPPEAPQGEYQIAVNTWTDDSYKERHADDLEWEPVFHAYNLVVLTPTSEKPLHVGSPANPRSIPVAVHISAPFLPYDAFGISIGGTSVTFERASTIIGGPFYWLESLGIYTFQLTPPNAVEGSFDLQVTVDYNDIIDATIENDAIIYSEVFEPIDEGLAWLRTRQYGDGSWYHSVGITSLAALAFLNSGYDETDLSVKSAIEYILSYVQADGSIGSDYYRTYETSIAILPLVATHNEAYSVTIENAKNWLVASQWDEDCIWWNVNKENWYYGGFGYGSHSRPDLSNTQWALMGLDAAGLPLDDPTWKRAQIFLARSQNRRTTVTIDFGDGTLYTVQPYTWQSNNGGFIYYPGASLAGGTMSYGSMTAAGIWSLLLCGVDVNDPRLKGDGIIKGGLDWIAEHYTLDSNPGMPGYMSQRFVYYHYVTLSKALTMARIATVNGNDWYQDLSNKLASLQYPDGYWVSSYSGHGSEYIPELATAYSILALQTRAGAPPIERLSYLTFVLRSNCFLRILDSEGKLVGYNYMTGLGENNIPAAVYSGPFSGPQYVIIVTPEAGIYDLELIGTSEGPYELTIQGNYGEEVTDLFEYTGEIAPAELHGTDVTVTAIVGPVDVYAEPPEFEEIIDNTPPSITVVTPREDPPEALQDGVTLEAHVTDPSGVDWVTFSIREPDGTIIDPTFESMGATDVGSDAWQAWVDTNVPELPDGYYLLLVNASDMLGNEGSKTVQFSISNWACLELLPATKANKAGRTMPAKFSLRVFENVDPAKPFVYNEELTILIYEESYPESILQESTYGDTARDYRIDSISELYITNFRTIKKKLTTYVIEIYRKDMLIGWFTFETVK